MDTPEPNDQLYIPRPNEFYAEQLQSAQKPMQNGRNKYMRIDTKKVNEAWGQRQGSAKVNNRQNIYQEDHVIELGTLKKHEESKEMAKLL